MKSLTEILRLYETAYRDLVRFKIKSLRLNKDQDWYFICTALDVIGDTTLAIKNFLQYGLEGAVDGDDDGEKYLRLYGILNATYLQQEAVYVLYKRNNLADPQKITEKIKKLKIFEIRNKIGAHSSAYKANKGKLSSMQTYESYIPTRHSLAGYAFEALDNETLEIETVNLVECLEQHLTLVIDLLDKICEKSIMTMYKGNQKKRKEFLDQLSELRKLNHK